MEQAENSKDKDKKADLLDKAEKIAQEVLSENPENDVAHNALAQNAIRKKNYNLAIKELSKAASINPDNYFYFYDI